MNQDVILETAQNLVVQWAGTDPMTCRADVVRAVEASGEVPEVEAVVEVLLPLLRARGLLVKPSWRDVPLYWLDSGKVLTDEERVSALAEYRASGGMYLVVMAEPSGGASPEDCKRLSEAGPEVDEIDWTDFPS